MKKSIIKAIAIVSGLCCLLGGCGDAKTSVKDDDGKKASVSTSEKQKVEKDEDKQGNDESAQAAEQESDGFVHDWSTGHENHYGYGTVNDWNRSERLRNYVVQDQWLYYSNDHRIYKMPVGGTAADVHVVYDTGYGRYSYDDLPALNIQVVGDWIYYFLESNDEVGGVYRVRTDGEMHTHLLTYDDMNHLYVNARQSDYYVIDERIYYIAKEKMGATVDSTNFYLAYRDLSSETNEVVKLMQVNEKTSIMAGFENSVILSEPYERVDLEGNVITEFENDRKLWWRMPELILWDYTDDMPTFMNMAYDVWNDGYQGALLIKHFQDGTNVKEKVDYYGNIYVDIENNEYYYEGHFPFEYPKNYYADAISGLYYGNKEGENRKINNDKVRLIFAGIDEYIYYDLDKLSRPFSSYDDLKRTPIKYRIKKDGTGFEEVSWMFP